MVKIVEVGEQIFLDVPYIKELPLKLRNRGGDWNGRNWVFENNLIIKKNLTEFLSNYFGYKVGGTTSNAVITALEEVNAEMDSIRFKGFVLASARGRDTGAKTGNGVTLLSGNIDSWGSKKNWNSYIQKGTRFLIPDFPIFFVINKKYSVEFKEDEK